MYIPSILSLKTLLTGLSLTSVLTTNVASDSLYRSSKNNTGLDLENAYQNSDGNVTQAALHPASDINNISPDIFSLQDILSRIAEVGAMDILTPLAVAVGLGNANANNVTLDEGGVLNRVQRDAPSYIEPIDFSQFVSDDTPGHNIGVEAAKALAIGWANSTIEHIDLVDIMQNQNAEHVASIQDDSEVPLTGITESAEQDSLLIYIEL